MKKFTLGDFAEFFLYLYLLYSLTSVSLNIYIPYLALFLELIAAFLALASAGFKDLFRPYLLLVLFTSGIFIFIQYVAFGIPLTGPYMNPFIYWPLLSLVIYPLARRGNFIQRLALAMLLIVVFLLPFSVVTNYVVYQRIHFLRGSTGIDNSDDLAAWLGFSALVLWLWAWQKTGVKRWLLLGAMMVALVLLFQTGARAALLTLAIGILLGTRSLTWRIRIISVLAIGLFVLGFMWLPQLASIRNMYASRLLVDTGRFQLWSEAWNDAGRHWLLGAGTYSIFYWASPSIFTTPHNAFLLIMNASGIIPTMLFIIIWGLSFLHALRSKGNGGIDRLPLLVYAFLEVFQSNLYFVSAWGVAALSAPFQEEEPGAVGNLKTPVFSRAHAGTPSSLIR